MKTCILLSLAFLLHSCCGMVDCMPPGINWRFVIVDPSGKDLLYDTDQKVYYDSLKMTSKGNDYGYVYVEPSSAIAYATPDAEVVRLSYRGLYTNLSFTLKQTSAGKCCGPEYALTEVRSDDGIVPKEERPVGTVYIIKLHQ